VVLLHSESPDGPQSRRVSVGGGLVCATHPALAPIPSTVSNEMINAPAGGCYDGDIHRSSTSDFSSSSRVSAKCALSHGSRPLPSSPSPRLCSCQPARFVVCGVPPSRTPRHRWGSGVPFPRATTGPRGSPCRHMLANRSVPTANAGCLPPSTPDRPTEVDLPCLVHALFAAASRHRRCGAKKTNQIIAQHPSKN